MGDIDQSLRLLRKAIYCDFDFVLAHYFLGNLYFQKNTPKQAIRHWQLALKLVENMDANQILPYSDDLTVDILVKNVTARLSTL